MRKIYIHIEQEPERPEMPPNGGAAAETKIIITGVRGSGKSVLQQALRRGLTIFNADVKLDSLGLTDTIKNKLFQYQDHNVVDLRQQKFTIITDDQA